MSRKIQSLTEEEIVVLAGADDTPTGRACLKVMALEEQKWAHLRDDDPQLNTERVHDDMRYVLGVIRGTNNLQIAINDAQVRLGIRAKGDEA